MQLLCDLAFLTEEVVKHSIGPFGHFIVTPPTVLLLKFAMARQGDAHLQSHLEGRGRWIT